MLAVVFDVDDVESAFVESMIVEFEFTIIFGLLLAHHHRRRFQVIRI